MIIPKGYSRKRRYVVSIGNRGALISETQEIFRLYAGGLSLAEIHSKIVHENILGKKSLALRENIFQITKQRYFDNASPDHIECLSSTLNSDLAEDFKNLILFFHLSLFDRLIFDFVATYVFQKYLNGALGITKLDFENFLTTQEQNHQEIFTWSASTRAKLARGILAALSQFGIMKGSKKKEFHRIYFPPEVFLYISLFLKDLGFSSKAIINAPHYRLFLQDKEDVISLMNEAVKKGYLHFDYRGDVYKINFRNNSLKEYVNELTGKIL